MVAAEFRRHRRQGIPESLLAPLTEVTSPTASDNAAASGIRDGCTRENVLYVVENLESAMRLDNGAPQSAIKSIVGSSRPRHRVIPGDR